MPADTPKIKINWEVNLGEILSILTALAAATVFIFGIWQDLDSRLQTHKTRIAVNERNIEINSKRMEGLEKRTQRQFKEVKTYLIRIDKKLDQKADKE
jgi:hypothetical protein